LFPTCLFSLSLLSPSHNFCAGPVDVAVAGRDDVSGRGTGSAIRGAMA
jgi:hypothetical protein